MAGLEPIDPTALRSVIRRGLSRREAAAELGVTVKRLDKAAKRWGVRFSNLPSGRIGRAGPRGSLGPRDPAKLERVKALLGQGLTQTAIAAQEGVTREAIRQYINRHGLRT